MGHQPNASSTTALGIRLLSSAVSLALLSLITALVAVEGVPILGPDLNDCFPVIKAKRTIADLDCCLLNTGKPIVDFKFIPEQPVRVRKAVHKVDDEFIRKYERAYELMRALPAHDPRSWDAQYKVHCAYCCYAYRQFNSSALLDVHHTWLFFPFHRWYVYFHERILGSLIGDDTFAIPYWAWDVLNETSPPPNILPTLYDNENSSLFDPFRTKIHRPPHRVDLRMQQNPPHNEEPETLKRHNYFYMWRAMVGEAKTLEAFYGKKYALGDIIDSRGGTVEAGPHAAVHKWTGDETSIAKEDMAPAYSAAKDTIFFAHHSQVDRLWLVWRELGGGVFDNPDWLDAEFLFYDENSDMVRVTVRDSLNLDKLRVAFEQVPADWLNYTPESIREMDPTLNRKGFLG